MLGVAVFQTPETLIHVVACFHVPDILIQNVLEGAGAPCEDSRVRSVIAMSSAAPTWPELQKSSHRLTLLGRCLQALHTMT